jgi:hypothetical protein
MRKRGTLKKDVPSRRKGKARDEREKIGNFSI